MKRSSLYITDIKYSSPIGPDSYPCITIKLEGTITPEEYTRLFEILQRGINVRIERRKMKLPTSGFIRLNK